MTDKLLELLEWLIATKNYLYKIFSSINLVRNISARHNLLLDTIGPRMEEVECYERALWYFWTVIITFLVCSLLELLLNSLYCYYVSRITRKGLYCNCAPTELPLVIAQKDEG